MTTRRKCPVCLRHVKGTQWWGVEPHTDKAGRQCPMNGQPFELALKVTV